MPLLRHSHTVVIAVLALHSFIRSTETDGFQVLVDLNAFTTTELAGVHQLPAVDGVWEMMVNTHPVSTDAAWANALHITAPNRYVVAVLALAASLTRGMMEDASTGWCCSCTSTITIGLPLPPPPHSQHKTYHILLRVLT
jgi:hypothetical protein